jgi:hypothetical protein
MFYSFSSVGVRWKGNRTPEARRQYTQFTGWCQMYEAVGLADIVVLGQCDNASFNRSGTMAMWTG